MSECENCYWLDNNNTCVYVDGYRPDIDGDCSNRLEKEFVQEIKENVVSDCVNKFAEILSNIPLMCGENCPVKCNWGTTMSCKDMCKAWLREQLKEV